METLYIQVYNSKYVLIDYIDDYLSLIWTIRYNICGEFELCLRLPSSHTSSLAIGNYLFCPISKEQMIIEKIQTVTDAETGDKLVVSGRSLLSLLSRRIIWDTLARPANSAVEYILTDLLHRQFGSLAANPARMTEIKPRRTSAAYKMTTTTDRQWSWDNVYDVFTGLCDEFDIGVNMTAEVLTQVADVHGVDQDRLLRFWVDLYAGVDRSISQKTYPPVIFSSKFDNLLSSEYLRDSTTLKNHAIIGGEGEGNKRVYNEYYSTGIPSDDLDRREYFVDARDLSTYVDENTVLSKDKYCLLLRLRGRDKLRECVEIKEFTGEIIPDAVYTYGTDYKLGDIITLQNAYGFEADARIIEVVYSVDESGTSVYPKYKIIK